MKTNGNAMPALERFETAGRAVTEARTLILSFYDPLREAAKKTDYRTILYIQELHTHFEAAYGAQFDAARRVLAKRVQRALDEVEEEARKYD